jgi:1-acyl-sn-glycerol-3-phosphate acyltransferase
MQRDTNRRMDAALTVNQRGPNSGSTNRESLVSRFQARLFFYWVIGCGFFSIMYTTSFYLLTPGRGRDHSIFRKWNMRMAKTLFFATRIKVETTYRAELDPSRPYVFIANHQSFLDIPVSAIAVPCPFGFVAKIELSRIPFLGHAIRYSPSVFIDRSNARKSLESMMTAASAIRSGTSVIVYPEGRRSFSRTLRPFKKGAFVLAVEAGVPVVPVVICDTYRVLNEKERSAKVGTVHVVVGDPIFLEGMSRKDIPELMENVAGFMRQELEEGLSQ